MFPSSAGAVRVLPEDLYLVFGEMRPGSGIAGGVEYQSNHFQNGLLDLRLTSRFSIRLYQQHEVQILRQHFIDPRLFLGVLGTYRSYTQIDYFGIGQETVEASHANFRLDGSSVFGDVGFRPTRHLAFGGRAGWVGNDVKPGRDDDLPSVEEMFDAGALPGIVEEPNYRILGFFGALDYRNDREDPVRGIYYQIQALRYHALGVQGFDFQELDVDARHFFPLASRFTLAFRVRGLFTWTSDGNQVPFFLLPSLGGTRSLHAFENDRFRDRNLLFFNNEIRYIWTPEIRLKAFLDLGEVFPDFGELRGSALELSTGFGAYYKFGDQVLFGAALGFGREGPRISFTGDLRY